MNEEISLSLPTGRTNEKIVPKEDKEENKSK